MAGIATGWTRFHIESVDARVAKRLAGCKAAAEARKSGEPKTGGLAITPEEAERDWPLDAKPRGRWVPIEDSQYCNPTNLPVIFTGEVERSKTAADSRGLAILAVFCIPFFWYFLLDRLREISDAIFHRNQH